MIQVNEIETTLSMSEHELLELLGTAGLGTVNFKELIGARQMLQNIASETDSEKAEDTLSNALVTKGEVIFETLWQQIKKIICQLYRDGTKIEGDADLVKYLASGLIAALAKTTIIIPAPLIAVIIVLALKKGLDFMCTN